MEDGPAPRTQLMMLKQAEDKPHRHIPGL